LKCAFLDNDTFESLYATSYRKQQAKIEAALDKIGCRGGKLGRLDYLFIPHFEPDRKHWALLGVAPQKFFFMINSCRWGSHYAHDQMETLGKIVTQQCPIIGRMDVLGDWPEKVRAGADFRPRCALQRDLYNCGVFTSTNAMASRFRETI
jgi:hypothetical protein